MDVEERLNSFRKEKKRKKTLDDVKKYISRPLDVLRKRMTITLSNETEPSNDSGLETERKSADTVSLLPTNVDLEEVELIDESEEAEEVEDNLLGLHGIAKYGSYFVLWAIPYVLLIKVGFGAVYFCVTGLIFIYFNTRTRPKLKNEPSAYSVFNVGCQPIEGALSGEQLEKEIRSGMLA